MKENLFDELNADTQTLKAATAESTSVGPNIKTIDLGSVADGKQPADSKNKTIEFEDKEASAKKSDGFTSIFDALDDPAVDEENKASEMREEVNVYLKVSLSILIREFAIF